MNTLSHLQPNQNGSRSGRSTTAQISALKRLTEGVKERNLKATLVLSSFKKTLDCIHIGKMLKNLRNYGVPELIVAAIELLYMAQKLKSYQQMEKQSSLKY